jgi:hypothetical protein
MDLRKIHCAAKKMPGIHATRHMLGQELPVIPMIRRKDVIQCK